MAVEQVFKAVEHDVVNAVFLPKIGNQRRARPAHRTRLGQQGVLESGEVAQAHKVGALLNGFGHGSS